MLKESLRRMRGITLIELMIVIVVLSVIVTVAIPNYREFAARAKRAEAKAALLQIATNQERHYLQNSTYTEDLTLLGFANDPQISDSGSYLIEVEPGADANTFVAIATYRNDDAERDKCFWFRIDGRGVKSSFPDLDCWTRTR